jgi:hypothetical protein
MFLLLTGFLFGFYLGVLITLIVRIIKVGDKNEDE